MAGRQSAVSSTRLKRRTPSAPSADAIDQVAQAIRDLHRSSSLEFAHRVGSVVLEKLYGGDFELLRDRGPKDASLRKLAGHPDLPLSASGLYQAIAVFEILERLGGVYACKHLCRSHVRAVLALPEEAQERLLERAEAQQWTVDRLKTEAFCAARPTGAGGRPPLPAFVKSLHVLRRYVDRPDVYFTGLDSACALSDERVQELRRVMNALRAKLDEIEAHLEQQPRSRRQSGTTTVPGKGSRRRANGGR